MRSPKNVTTVIAGLGWLLCVSSAMSQSVIEAPPMEDDNPTINTRRPLAKGMPDPYLWHVTGLPQGSDL
ncbi:hypothetical protein, partial [Rhizobium sp.]|uniref:hypothetical protein n=1 Tax=Rhizobium sp. TaxID=391 RepID=UPI000E90E156|nr:hypothetical protein [Rhizobium sp.]